MRHSTKRAQCHLFAGLLSANWTVAWRWYLDLEYGPQLEHLRRQLYCMTATAYHGVWLLLVTVLEWPKEISHRPRADKERVMHTYPLPLFQWLADLSCSAHWHTLQPQPEKQPLPSHSFAAPLHQCLDQGICLIALVL